MVRIAVRTLTLNIYRGKASLFSLRLRFWTVLCSQRSCYASLHIGLHGHGIFLQSSLVYSKSCFGFRWSDSRSTRVIDRRRADQPVHTFLSFSISNRSHLASSLEQYLDNIHYVQDIFLLDVNSLNRVLKDQLMNRLLIPIYVFSLTKREKLDHVKVNVVMCCNYVNVTFIEHLVLRVLDPFFKKSDRDSVSFEGFSDDG